MIGVLGLGAAGGNIADEAKKKGFEAIAINYSQSDLDSLEHIDEKLKLVGSEGVGKNRNVAIQLMGKNWESAVEFVRENFSMPSIEIIFVAFSTGGGSGSGMAPVLLDILMNEFPEKIFVAVPILPDKTEVITNQINSVRTVEELSKLDLCVMPIDNEQVKKSNLKVGKRKIYQETNKTFVNLLNTIVDYTGKHSKDGVIDRKDLRTIWNTNGVCIISFCDVTKSSADKSTNVMDVNVADIIHESWEDNIFAPLESDRIVRAGVIYDGDDSLLEYLDFEEIFSVFENGMPIDLFEGYYHQEAGSFYTVLAGLPWFDSRLKETEALIQSKKSAAEEVLVEKEGYQSGLDDLKLKPKKKRDTKRSVTDILSRYKP